MQVRCDPIVDLRPEFFLSSEDLKNSGAFDAFLSVLVFAAGPEFPPISFFSESPSGGPDTGQ